MPCCSPLTLLVSQIPSMQARYKSVLVLDNSSIHYNAEFRAAMAEAGIKCVFLPPYSPSFNPIEEAFSSVKAFIRRHGKLLLCHNYPTEAIIGHALDSITADKCAGWIKHAGYF